MNSEKVLMVLAILATVTALSFGALHFLGGSSPPTQTEHAVCLTPGPSVTICVRGTREAVDRDIREILK